MKIIQSNNFIIALFTLLIWLVHLVINIVPRACLAYIYIPLNPPFYFFIHIYRFLPQTRRLRTGNIVHFVRSLLNKYNSRKMRENIDEKSTQNNRPLSLLLHLKMSVCSDSMKCELSLCEPSFPCVKLLSITMFSLLKLKKSISGTSAAKSGNELQIKPKLMGDQLIVGFLSYMKSCCKTTWQKLIHEKMLNLYALYCKFGTDSKSMLSAIFCNIYVEESYLLRTDVPSYSIPEELLQTRRPPEHYLTPPHVVPHDNLTLGSDAPSDTSYIRPPNTVTGFARQCCYFPYLIVINNLLGSIHIPFSEEIQQYRHSLVSEEVIYQLGCYSLRHNRVRQYYINSKFVVSQKTLRRSKSSAIERRIISLFRVNIKIGVFQIEHNMNLRNFVIVRIVRIKFKPDYNYAEYYANLRNFHKSLIHYAKF
uniref:Uncharacterized protein n=1 Tax=Heterorhabditis bacteriophora TaxID=37862 RepID=A0A1I7W808_HETBA